MIELKFHLKDGTIDRYDPVDMNTFIKTCDYYRFDSGIYDYEVRISDVEFYEVIDDEK